MPLSTTLKREVRTQIEKYEGRVTHLYRDTVGKVTVGVGHLIKDRNAIATIPLYNIKKIPHVAATIDEKKAEYDKIAKLPFGKSYGAKSFKPHTSLMMRASDIDIQRDKHINKFYIELTTIYTKSKGYPHNFDDLPNNVQLALFDMIFNLGAAKLIVQFTNFNLALKAEDWKKAAKESKRYQLSAQRNLYVKNLLMTVPTPVKAP